MATLPTAIISSVELGNSDVVLIEMLEDRSFDVTANKTTDNSISINFYTEPCSNIELKHLPLNLSRRLEVTGSDSHGIGEHYLINGSQIQYTFSTSSVQPPTTPCVAMAYIFHDSVNYFEFIRTGKVNQANATCLPSASTVSIMVSAEDEDQYLFIGVKSFVQATIDYTVIGHNVSILSPPTMCSLSLLSPEC